MTTITCDLCDAPIKYRGIKVEVREGEHPHAGATMHKNIDVCTECIHHIPKLASVVEFDVLRKGRRPDYALE